MEFKNSETTQLMPNVLLIVMPRRGITRRCFSFTSVWIASAVSAKEAWDALENYYAGDEKLKKVKLQTLRRQFELLQMENLETVADYFTRVKNLTNLMQGCGEKVSEKLIVEKIMHTLTPRFDYITTAIEESKNLDVMKVEELQGSLEAHEQRLNERSSDRPTDRALQAKVQKPKHGDKGKGWKGKGKQHGNSSAGSYSSHKAQSHYEKGEPSYKKKGDSSHQKGGKKKFDRSKIQCFNCQKYGHFVDECRGPTVKRANSNDEAHVAQEEGSDSNEVMLMVTNGSDPVNSESWYLDTGCSNHMTGHKDWLIDFDSRVKSKVKFADNSTIAAEGIGKIVIKRKNGEPAYVTDVLYVPSMKTNLLSLGQLLENGFSMTMQNNYIEVFDCKQRKVFQAPLAKNRTFKVNLNVAEIQCLCTTVTTDDRWLWHYRFGHLNFRSLH